LTFGVIAYRWLVLRPPGLGVGLERDRRVWRLVDAGIGALLLAEPLALLAQAHSLGDADWLDEAVLGAALASSFGRALGQRLAAAGWRCNRSTARATWWRRRTGRRWR